MKSWELKDQRCGTSGQACEMQTSARSVRGLALEPSGCSARSYHSLTGNVRHPFHSPSKSKVLSCLRLRYHSACSGSEEKNQQKLASLFLFRPAETQKKHRGAINTERPEPCAPCSRYPAPYSVVRGPWSVVRGPGFVFRAPCPVLRVPCSCVLSLAYPVLVVPRFVNDQF